MRKNELKPMICLIFNRIDGNSGQFPGEMNGHGFVAIAKLESGPPSAVSGVGAAVKNRAGMSLIIKRLKRGAASERRLVMTILTIAK